jgi:hypothetical protein
MNENDKEDAMRDYRYTLLTIIILLALLLAYATSSQLLICIPVFGIFIFYYVGWFMFLLTRNKYIFNISIILLLLLACIMPVKDFLILIFCIAIFVVRGFEVWGLMRKHFN